MLRAKIKDYCTIVGLGIQDPLSKEKEFHY